MPEIKISDEFFLAVLRSNGGLYAKTAKDIEEKYGIQYTRQAVRQRAAEHPEVFADIEEEVADMAEGGLQALMQDPDPKIRLDAIRFYLKTKAKRRGYIERQEIEHSGDQFKINIIMPPTDDNKGD